MFNSLEKYLDINRPIKVIQGDTTILIQATENSEDWETLFKAINELIELYPYSREDSNFNQYILLILLQKLGSIIRWQFSFPVFDNLSELEVVSLFLNFAEEEKAYNRKAFKELSKRFADEEEDID